MLLSSSCIGWNFEVQRSANSDAQKNSRSASQSSTIFTIPISFSTKPWGKLRNSNSKEDADAYAGKGGLNNFFSVVPKKKKRGRPAKNAKKRGRPPRNNKLPPTPPPHLRKSPPEIAAANNDGNNDGIGPVEEAGGRGCGVNLSWGKMAGRKSSILSEVDCPIVAFFTRKFVVGENGLLATSSTP